jgi:branched-chain amino acid transport system permease protein
MFLRPNLYTSYEQETQILPTFTKKVLAVLAIATLFLMPFEIWPFSGPTDIAILRDVPILRGGIPPMRFLGDANWLRFMNEAMIIAIAALGLNILTGMAGQVSLGHAFFMGTGAYAGATLGGIGTTKTIGWELPIWIWLPGAGVVAAVIGIIISPVAVRLRGLYLAIVTLGLVFLGIHMGNTNWGRRLAGDPSLGRDFPAFDIRLWKEEKPLVDLSNDGKWLWFDVNDNQKEYIFLAVLMLAFLLLALNIARTRVGRALQAIRDRDIAAEVMGVQEFRYKLVAFATSSFFAGVAGALFASHIGKLPATQFSLALSVEFIAILLIGGAGTVSGTMMGAFFVILMPELVKDFTDWLSDKTTSGGIGGTVAETVLTKGSTGDFGPVSVGTQAPGYALNVFDWNLVLYGVLIIVFLIFEPLGLYGIWVKIRNYWKRWPFSY